MFLTALGGLSAVIISVIWGGFWVGLCVSTMWTWFAVIPFGLPAIGLIHAYGFSLMARALMGFSIDEKQKGRPIAEVCMEQMIKAPVICGMVLGIAWIAKFFM